MSLLVQSVDSFKPEGDILESLRACKLVKLSILEQLSENSNNSDDLLWCVSSGDVSCTDATLTGGKGSSLAILNAVRGVCVPEFFCVTTRAFVEGLSTEGRVKHLLDELQDLSDSGEPLLAACQDLREAIEQVALPEKVAAAVRSSYDALCVQVGEENVPCAVRSSATTEDTKDASFAGQHDTFLFQRGVGDILKCISRSWASVFTSRAVEYRNEHGIPHSDAIMAVVVQRMVQPSVAGTSFSMEISTTYPGVHICATYGLGEAIVNGSVTGDEWLVDRESGEVIKQVCGSKLLEYVAKKNGSGIETREVERKRRSSLCMPKSSVEELVKATTTIRALYQEVFGYDNIDTEFALDQEQKLFLLQCRPIVEMDLEVQTVEDPEKGDALLKGHYSLLGAATGKLKVVIDFEDLSSGRVQIQEDDILVTLKTSNYFNPFLQNLKGICTLEGSACAHPMLIGRERKLPVVCGIPGGSLNLLHRLAKWNGMAVTLDGYHRTLFAGTLELRTLTADELTGRFAKVAVEHPPNDGATVRFLKMYKRLHVDERGENWVYNPNSALSPMWSEIRLQSYAQRISLVNAARSQPLGKDPFCAVARVFRVDSDAGKVNKVADLLVPAAQTLSAFQGMTLEECERFYEVCEQVGEDMMESARVFNDMGSAERMNQYVTCASRLYAATWLSYFFRLYVNEVLSSLARKLGVSQLHYEHTLKHAQRQIEGEDDAYQNELKHAALDMLPILQGNPPEQRPHILRQIEHMAENFRVEKETSVTRPLALETVLHTVLEKAFMLSQNPTVSAPGKTVASSLSPREGDDFEDKEDEKTLETTIEYFPAQKELQRWVHLSVAARVQMSSWHHLKVRAQNLVKAELLKVARVMRIAVWQDILLTDSLSTLEGLLLAYEIKPKILERSGSLALEKQYQLRRALDESEGGRSEKKKKKKKKRNKRRGRMAGFIPALVLGGCIGGLVCYFVMKE